MRVDATSLNEHESALVERFRALSPNEQAQAAARLAGISIDPTGRIHGFRRGMTAVVHARLDENAKHSGSSIEIVHHVAAIILRDGTTIPIDGPVRDQWADDNYVGIVYEEGGDE